HLVLLPSLIYAAIRSPLSFPTRRSSDLLLPLRIHHRGPTGQGDHRHRGRVLLQNPAPARHTTARCRLRPLHPGRGRALRPLPHLRHRPERLPRPPRRRDRRLRTARAHLVPRPGCRRHLHRLSPRPRRRHPVLLRLHHRRGGACRRHPRRPPPRHHTRPAPRPLGLLPGRRRG